MGGEGKFLIGVFMQKLTLFKRYDGSEIVEIYLPRPELTAYS